MGTPDRTLFRPCLQPIMNIHVSLVMNPVMLPVTCDLGQCFVSRVVSSRRGDHFLTKAELSQSLPLTWYLRPNSSYVAGWSAVLHLAFERCIVLSIK